MVTALLMLLVSQRVSASHIMGSDITYKCLSKWKYEVVMKVYRDCNGTTLGTSQSLYVECTSGSWSKSYNFSYIGKTDITGLSPSCSTKSQCAGGSFAYGIEEHLFKVTIDLTSVSCTEFRLSWSQSARNNSITTGASGKNFYTEAILRTDLSACNSSPVFTTPAATLVCVNEDFVFNNGALDTLDNGDSLSYKLVSPLSAKGTAISYNSGFSATIPITFLGYSNPNLSLPSGFHLDSITGDLAFRPTKQNEITVMVLEVTEWRKINGTMTVIGKTRRDIQVGVISCTTSGGGSNSPPVITGISKETCPNQQVCIKITTADPNTNDSVRVTWNGGIPGATFTSSNGSIKWDTAQICWTPKETDVSTVPYTFTITAQDNGCPFSTQSVKAFTIFVYEPPAAVQHALGLGCGHVAVSYTPNKNYTSLTQEWTARDSLGTLVSTSYNKTDTLLLPKGKAYIRLKLRALGDCETFYYDTLLIPEHVEVHLPPDTFACENKQITVSSLTKDGLAPFHYVWNTSPADTLTTFTLDTAKGKKYWLTVTDAVGCRWWDTIRVRWDTIPKTQFTTPTICEKNGVTFTNTTFAAQKDSITYTWYFGDTTAVVAKNPAKTFTTADSLLVKMRAVTDKGCKDSITRWITVNPKPYAAFTVNDTDQCKKGNNFSYANTTTLQSGSATYKWYFGDNDSSAATNISHLYKADGTFKTRQIATSDKGCRDSASRTMVVYPDPVAGYTISNPNQCLTGNKYTFNNTSTIKAGSLTYRWDFDNGDTSLAKHPVYTFSTYDTFNVQMIAIAQTTNCRDTITKKMVVHPMPAPKFATNDTSQCKTGNSFVYTNQSTIPYGTLSYLWDLGDGNGGNSTNYTNTYISDLNYTVKLTTTSGNGCSASVSRMVYVRPMPAPSFTINNSGQCVNKNQFVFTNSSTIKYGSLQYLWDFGNGKTSAQTDTSLVYTYDSVYRVILKATSDYGCIDTVGKNVTIYSKPNPAYTVNDSTQCVNTDLFTFTNNSTIKQGSMFHVWTFGDATYTTAVNPSHGYVNDTIYPVKLKITSDMNCVDSVTHMMTVYPKPKASFTVNTANQCRNINQYAFTGTSTIKYGSLSYLWDLGNSKQATAKDTGIVYATDGTYTVILYPKSNNGCYDTTSQLMTVYPVPVPAFTTNDSDQCLNINNYVFTNNTTIVSGSINYEWNFDTEGTSTAASPNFVFSKDTTYTVKMKAISDKSCTDSVYHKVTLFPVPKPDFAINDTAQCVNTDLFSFTNKSKIKYGTLQYHWYFGSGDSSTAVSPKYGYEADGQYKVTLKPVSNYNCVDSTGRIITVIPKPQARFAIDDSSQCVNPGKFTFTNQSIIKYPTTLTYSWNLDSVKTTAKDTAVVYGKNGEYHPTLITKSAENCYDTFMRIVLVYPKPYPAFTINADTQCVTGNNYVLTNKTTIDSGDLHYTWFYGDTKTDTLINPSHSYAVFGDYVIKMRVVSGFGCRDSISKPVAVQPTPAVDFTVNDSGQCVNDNLFVFTNKSTIKFGTLTYQWDFANGITSKKTDTAVRYNYDSTFRVVLKATSNLGCTDTNGHYVVVHSKPTPAYIVDDSTQCMETQLDSLFDFTNTSTIKDVSGLTSNWYFSDGQAISGNAISTKFNNPITYTLKLLQTSGFGCKDSTTGQVIVYPHPNPDFVGLAKQYCTDYPVFSLTPVVPGGTFSGKNMLGDAYTPNNTGLDTVKYTVQVNGCYNDTDKYTIVYPLPVLNLGNDTTLCKREVIFFNVAFPNSTYIWQDGLNKTPVYRAWQPGTYRVTMYNVCDTLTDEIKVTFRDYDCNYFFPTAFTPNGDGKNDVFIPYLENAIELHMKVFDRWGGLVFESDEVTKGWDGNMKSGDPAPIGTYIWHIEAKFNNLGFIYTQAENGNVTLVR